MLQLITLPAQFYFDPILEGLVRSKDNKEQEVKDNILVKTSCISFIYHIRIICLSLTLTRFR